MVLFLLFILSLFRPSFKNKSSPFSSPPPGDRLPRRLSGSRGHCCILFYHLALPSSAALSTSSFPIAFWSRLIPSFPHTFFPKRSKVTSPKPKHSVAWVPGWFLSTINWDHTPLRSFSHHPVITTGRCHSPSQRLSVSRMSVTSATSCARLQRSLRLSSPTRTGL